MNIIQKLACSALLMSPLAMPAANVALHTPANFQVLSVSPNGNWACGVYLDAATNMYAFRWDLQSDNIEMLGTGTSLAWDVANDGTVSGESLDTQVLESHVPVNVPSYWRDGTWHHLEMPEGNISDGIGNCISPDGQYMVGTLCIDGRYVPYIWKNGKIHRCLDTGSDAVASAVSPDGGAAAGFNTLYNRAACYWPAEGEIVYFLDSPEMPQSPWNYARNFSPDGTKLLYWGGWEIDEENEELYLYAIYDIATGERIKVKAPSMTSDMEFHDISDTGVMVGSEDYRGYVQTAEQGWYIDDYLTYRGFDVSTIASLFYNGGDSYVGKLPISTVPSISADANVLAMQYYDTDGNSRSLVIKLDQDFSAPAPVNVSARQLQGISTAVVEWKKPVGASNIRGYNVYRDGAKLNGLMPLNVLSYYDKNLAPGTYAYKVTAVTTSGVETAADEVMLTVATSVAEGPNGLFARQKGVNSAQLMWRPALSSLTHKRYFDIGSDYTANFYVYQPITMEAAVRYSHAEMACYSGYTIDEVSFVPMGSHTDWRINLYEVVGDNIQLISSQAISQSLNYHTINTVKLDAPVAIPQGDLIVAIQLTVDPEEGATVGSEEGTVVPGYSDLIRQIDEDGLYSTYEASLMSAASLTRMSWAIDIGLNNPEVQNPALDCYEMTISNAETNALVDTFQTTDCTMTVPAMEAGQYTAMLCAVQTDGSKTSPIAASFDIVPVYPKVAGVVVDGVSPATITWSAPKDSDPQDLTYSTAETCATAVQGNESNDYTITVGVRYAPARLKGLGGYEIKKFRYYPVAEAQYAVILYKNSQEILYYDLIDPVLNQWNEAECPEEILIDEDAEYLLAVEVYEPTPETGAYGMDSGVPYVGYSDLYSDDRGETWMSLGQEYFFNGNWMLGMVVEDTEGAPLEVDGYDLYIDNKRINDATIAETTASYDFGAIDNRRHWARVDAYYRGVAEAVEGETTYFTLSHSALSSVEAAEITLRKGQNVLVAEGAEVQEIVLYSTTGVEVAKAPGNQVNISHVAPGAYIVSIVTDKTRINKKITIK